MNAIFDVINKQECLRNDNGTVAVSQINRSAEVARRPKLQTDRQRPGTQVIDSKKSIIKHVIVQWNSNVLLDFCVQRICHTIPQMLKIKKVVSNYLNFIFFEIHVCIFTTPCTDRKKKSTSKWFIFITINVCCLIMTKSIKMSTDKK